MEHPARKITKIAREAERLMLSISHRVYESLGGRIIQVQAAS